MNSDYIREMGRLMLGYLPAAYREDAESEEFLERFLGIFGSEIMKNEELIGQIPRYFDPMELTADEDDFLRWLAGWLSLDLFDQYSSKNRDYLLKAAEFYRKKGTEAGLVSMLEFFTDRKVVLTKDKSSTVFRSYHKSLVDRYHPISLVIDTNDKDLIGKMGTKDDTVHYIYDGGSGDSGDSFHTVDIYLEARQQTPSDEANKEKEILMKLLEPFLPALMKVNILEI
jgi:phage tail-like protein